MAMTLDTDRVILTPIR